MKRLPSASSLAASFLLPLFACGVYAQAPTPTAEAAKSGHGELDLSKFPGMVLEDVVVPVPSELLTVLDKLGDPDWKKELQLSARPVFTDRQDVALLLGATVADGFIAVQAGDVDSIEKIGREVLQLARSLGVKDAVTQHCNLITTAAKKNDWAAVRAALDATQATVRERMELMKDGSLAEFISIGGWLRGTQVITSVIGKSFTPERAELLHQPDLARYFLDTLQELEAKGKPAEKMSLIGGGLTQIHEIMANTEQQLDKEAVATIQRITTELVNRIQTKG